jgi:hypothetical protein
MFVTGAAVEIDYARALAEILPLRLVPTSGLHLGDESPWQSMAHLFGAVGEPAWSIASAPLGATCLPTASPMFAALFSPGPRNVALVIGGGSATKDAPALARYDAVIAVDDTIGSLLAQQGICASVVPPDADALRRLLKST